MRPRDLSAHSEYVPGAGTRAVAEELGRDPAEFLALGSNENPLGPSPKAVSAIQAGTAETHRYPKASHTELTEAVAEQWDVSSEQIWLAPGADGAIDYLSRAMLEPGDRVLVPEPGFSYYQMSTRYHHGGVDSYPVSREELFIQSPQAVLDAYNGHRIVYLTTPHNPTGTVLSVDEIRTVAANTDDDTIVVVDEAYGEFSTTDSAVSLLSDRSDVAVLRTFSKAYGLAGLRVGYAVVPPEWATAYSRVNTPFAVNELACRGAAAALTDESHLEASVTLARTGRDRLREALPVWTQPSEGNFILAAVGDGAAAAEALKHRGIIVRDCASFGLPEYIRITVPEEAALDRVIDAVTEITADSHP